MSPGDRRLKLRALVRDKRTIFLNLTKTISLYSLDLGPEFNLGGRDSLIVGCYMRNGMETMLTHDKELLKLKKLRFKAWEIAFVNPWRRRTPTDRVVPEATGDGRRICFSSSSHFPQPGAAIVHYSARTDK